MSSNESNVDDVCKYDPEESSACVSHDGNTNDSARHTGMDLVRVEDESSPVERPKRMSRVSGKSAKAKRKEKRNKGLAYITETGKEVEERKLGDNCTCRSKCMEVIGKTECARIFSSFWALGDYSVQNAYLADLIDVCEVKCKTKHVEGNSGRKITMKYRVNVNEFDKKVCRQAFLSLHGIGKRRVMCLLNKKHSSDNPRTDMRGRHSNRPNKINCEDIDYVKAHINSIPKQPNHCNTIKNPNKNPNKNSNKNSNYLSSELNIIKLYCMYKEECMKNNKKPVSEFRYKYIFNHEFNLSFGTSSKRHAKTKSQVD